MALSVQSTSAPYSATQVYVVTGNTGDTVTATIDDVSVSAVTPASAVLGASGYTFTASRVGTRGGACSLTFKDTTTGEQIVVTVNHAGDPTAVPDSVSGVVGATGTLQILELNDPASFASITIEDSTVASISITSNAEGNAVIAYSLLANGNTLIDVDDGHGGTLAVPVLVGAALPARNLTIQPIEAVIGGTVVSMGQAVVALQDSSTGYNGAGNYTISLTSDKTYVVSNGIPPAESTTQINVASAVLRADGTIFLADKRTINVTAATVNQVIAAEDYSDGSPVNDSMITMRTLAPDVQAALGSSGSGPTEPTSPHEGELFYNTTTNVFEIFEGGSWRTISVIGEGVLSLDGKTGALTLVDGTNITVDDSAASSITLNGPTDAHIAAQAPIQSITTTAPITKTGTTANPVIGITSPLPVANGGSGTATPSLVAGSNISITGSWPNQTINSTGPSANYMPLANGDTPGVSLIGDSSGQPIAVPL